MNKISLTLSTDTSGHLTLSPVRVVLGYQYDHRQTELVFTRPEGGAYDGDTLVLLWSWLDGSAKRTVVKDDAFRIPGAFTQQKMAQLQAVFYRGDAADECAVAHSNIMP